MRPIVFTLLFVACAAPQKRSDAVDMDIDVPWEAASPDLGESRLAAPQSAPEAPVSDMANLARSSEEPALHTSSYHLSYAGKRIGQAREVFHRSKQGVRIIRREEIRVMRGGVPVESETEVIIHADTALKATRVELVAIAGAVERKGQAIRADDGSWVISLEGEKVRKASAKAVPMEMVPYLLAKSGNESYHSEVLLAGYGFAVTTMRVQHQGRKGVAVLQTPWGEIESQLALYKDGSLARAETGSTGSVRVKDGDGNADFSPPEILEEATLKIAGKGEILSIGNTEHLPPPALAGQSVSLRKSGWQVHFETETPKVSKLVRRLTREVDSLLQQSHDAPGAGASDAMSLGRGDCTAHAALLVDLAREQGLEAKLITGFRINGNKMARHRWVAVREGDKWVQVDPTFGEAPTKPGQHLALALHNASTAEIALVDEAVFRGLSKATLRWTQSPIAVNQ